jgi:hypothetical protein
MIKFTRLMLSVKESTLEKIDALQKEYSEEIERADMLNLDLPTSPRYTLTIDDYNIKERDYYVRAKDIIEIYKDSDDITCLTIDGSNEKPVYVKETIKDVLKHID